MIEEFLSEFQAAMHSAGLKCLEPLIADRKLHRFKAANDTKPNSWYIFFPDTIPAGAFGCWKRNIKQPWCSVQFKKLSPENQMTIQQYFHQAKQAFNEAQEKIYQETSRRANRIWQKGLPIRVASPKYLTLGKVRAY
jgi:putative DNA primase/helicase